MSCCSKNSNSKVADFFSEIQCSTVVSEREKCLIGLAISFATNNSEAVKKSIIQAKLNEISNDEIEFICTFTAASIGVNIESLIENNSKSNKQGACCT
ncbi:hypothetical protein CLHUN_21660 [Ruminiclostridium hungatei]|uniref:Carboxymuconolactone decarboxylase family protein n=1 Tax=Ruminiclostridium hungatei TaxID=48256 RepID=A0A1V4SJH5_RUMHU|nr:hypothetical protein [Ruminiclostridium hungatei]OPX43923.1 hypothetical protein CLHUN_21660 [Ruminiclostridium hungatei]